MFLGNGPLIFFNGPWTIEYVERNLVKNELGFDRQKYLDIYRNVHILCFLTDFKSFSNDKYEASFRPILVDYILIPRVRFRISKVRFPRTSFIWILMNILSFSTEFCTMSYGQLLNSLISLYVHIISRHWVRLFFINTLGRGGRNNGGEWNSTRDHYFASPSDGLT